MKASLVFVYNTSVADPDPQLSTIPPTPPLKRKVLLQKKNLLHHNSVKTSLYQLLYGTKAGL